MNWYKIAQTKWPSWFSQEIATESENVNMAIMRAEASHNKEFEGVSLKELQDAKQLLNSDPVEYFRSETFRHNYMCARLFGKVEGYENHCKLGKLYGNIHRKIENWKRKQLI